jgi:hypothetical protein
VVTRLGHRDYQVRVPAVHRERELASSDFGRDHGQGGGIGLVVLEVDEFETGLVSARPNEITFGQLAAVDQDPPREVTRPRLLGCGGLKLLFGYKTLFDE